MEQLSRLPYMLLHTSLAGLSLAPCGLGVAQGGPRRSLFWVSDPVCWHGGGVCCACWHCRTSGGLSLLTPAPHQGPQPGSGARCLPSSRFPRAGLPEPCSPQQLSVRPPPSSPAQHTVRGGSAYQHGCKNELLCCINIFTLLSSH